MRTTVDIPDDLLRLAKATAVLRGVRLADVVTTALREALADAGAASSAGREPLAGESERQDLGHGCLLPLIRGEGGPALRRLTPRRLTELLEDEDVARSARRS